MLKNFTYTIIYSEIGNVDSWKIGHIVRFIQRSLLGSKVCGTSRSEAGIVTL